MNDDDDDDEDEDEDVSHDFSSLPFSLFPFSSLVLFTSSCLGRTWPLTCPFTRR